MFKSLAPGQFRLLISVVPPSPLTNVTLTLTNTVVTAGTASRDAVKPDGSGPGCGLYQASYDYADKNTTLTVDSDPGGWTIVPLSVSYLYNRNKNLAVASLLIPVSPGRKVYADLFDNKDLDFATADHYLIFHCDPGTRSDHHQHADA
jgi:hypothetical protein